MFGYAKKDGFLCLVTQYIKGGDLSKGLKDSSKKLDLRLQTEFAVSITAGMIYLHKNGVIHRDLKVTTTNKIWPFFHFSFFSFFVFFFFLFFSLEIFLLTVGMRQNFWFVILVSLDSFQKHQRKEKIKEEWLDPQPTQLPNCKKQIMITKLMFSVLESCMSLN